MKYTASLLALLTTLLFWGLHSSIAKTASASNTVNISLPAEALRQSLNSIAPIILDTDKYVDGDITIESIDSLHMADNIIKIQGVLGGHNLSVATNIAGQEIRLKLGEVRLPLACDVSLRFDKTNKKLFIRPTFNKHKEIAENDPAAAIVPLLTALGEKEYPLDLSTIQPLNARIGNRQVPIRLEPMSIKAENNTLYLALQPKIKRDKKRENKAVYTPRKSGPTS